MRKLTVIVTSLLLLSNVFAEIKFSGHARVRPRIDIEDDGIFGGKTTDVHYLYRGRLNLEANIGDGWYFKTSLGHNGPSYWNGKFGDGDYLPSPSSDTTAARTTVDFMELYFGHNGEKCGFSAGIIPMKSIGNPTLDLHFYPQDVVDIPFYILNNDATHGFNFYKNIFGGKLDAFLTVDENVVEVTVDITGTAKDMDTYSLGLQYSMDFGGHQIQPIFWKTFAPRDVPSPMTVGANIKFPELAGFNFSLSGAYTKQNVENTEEYFGHTIRAKVVKMLGVHSLVAWFDNAKVTRSEDDYTDFNYLWVHFKYFAYKSDLGSFYIQPTFRLHMRDILTEEDYTRTRFEITTQFTF